MMIQQLIRDWQPDMSAPNVLAIDYDALYAKGIRCVAYDVDGTITKNGSLNMSSKTAKLLQQKLDTAKITKRYLASNSVRPFTNILKDLTTFKVVQPLDHKGKPSKEYYQQLIDKTELQPNQIAFMGDRALQDVWGPNRMGLMTIQIELQPIFAGGLDKLLGRHIWQRLLIRRHRK